MGKKADIRGQSELALRQYFENTVHESLPGVSRRLAADRFIAVHPDQVPILIQFHLPGVLRGHIPLGQADHLFSQAGAVDDDTHFTVDVR